MNNNIFNKTLAVVIIALFIGASITITPNMFIQTVKADINDGLIGYWSFNDESNPGGTLLGGASWTDSGKYGGAIAFDGIDDAVNMGSDSNYVMTTAFTISAWIYPTDSPVSWAESIVNKEGEYQIARESSGEIMFGIANSDPYWLTWVYTGYTPQLNQWTHITWTYSASAGILKFVANGDDYVFTKSGSGVIGDHHTDWDDLRVGGRQNHNENHNFGGKIDEVRLYNRALNPDEIQQLPVAGGGGQPPSENLISYWSFDEESGNIAHDSIGGNDGTLTNMDTSICWVDGISGNALSFDGINDYVEVTNVNDFYFADQSLTYSVWVQIRDNVNKYRPFICLEDYNDAYPHITIGKYRTGHPTGAGRIFFSVYDASQQGESIFSIDEGDELLLDTWMHVAGVVDYESGSITLYIDGEVQDSKSISSFDMSEADSLKLVIGGFGCPYHSYSGFHYGLIDEVRIYNKALTQDDIDILFEQGNEENQAPVADFLWSTLSSNEGELAGEIQLDASTSNDPDGTIISYEWDLDNDGIFNDLNGISPTYEWNTQGTYLVSLLVKDDGGSSNIISKEIIVGYYSGGLVYYWELPTNSEEIEIHDKYEIKLKTYNLNTQQMTFSYGLDYSYTPYNPFENIFYPPFFGEETTCHLNGNPYDFSMKSDMINPYETKIYIFTISNDWIWIPPWNWAEIIIIQLFNIEGITQILQNIYTWITSVPHIKYNYIGMGDVIWNTENEVNVCISYEKQEALTLSVQASAVGSIETIIGEAALLFPPFGVIAAATAFAIEAAFIYTSFQQYERAYDPDSNYTEIIQPDSPYIPDLRDIPQIEKYYAELALNLPPIAKACKDSYAKYLGAKNAESIEWQIIQLSSMKYYGQKLADIMLEMYDIFENQLPVMPPLTIDNLSIILNYLSTEGLPKLEIEILKQYGLTDDEIDGILQSLLATDAMFYMNVYTNFSKIFENMTSLYETSIDNYPEPPEGTNIVNLDIYPKEINTTTNLPTFINCYIEFPKKSDLSGYNVTSAYLNNQIEPIYISQYPGDYDNDGIEDIKIAYNVSDILSLIKEGNLLISINGNVTLPSLNTNLFSGASLIIVHGNAPDTPKLPFGPILGKQNTVYQYSINTTDPENNSIFYLFDWGNGNYSDWVGPFDNEMICCETHSWVEFGTYNIRVKAKDKWGQISDWSENLSVAMESVPPLTSKSISSPKYSGNNEWITSSTEFNFTATDDLSGVNKTYYRIWYENDWTPWLIYTGNFTLSGEGKHYLEYYSVDFAENIEEVHNQTHYVDDSSPEITALNLPLNPVEINTVVNLNTSFFDEIFADSHNATIDWGDGNVTNGIVDEINQTISDNWSYAEPGVYTVNLTIEDYFGRTDSEIYEFVVVYDPSAGFVTGGGWIDSPEGAYKLNQSISGKANFGFNSKYKKNSPIPTGNTNFNFQEADLHFQSTCYYWLVIAGSIAIYMGNGTVNDEGNYEFVVTIVDSEDDKFGIKIMDKDNDKEIIYDNGLTTLGGGQIKIHKG